MRVMVIVKGNQDTENGVMPTEAELSEMGAYNEQLVNAGIMVGGDGLHPTSKAVRVSFDGDSPSVTDGPFTESKELIAGFWLWEVKDMDEAVEWLKRAPFREGSLDIRPVFEADDFGDEYTDELRARDAELDAKIEANQG